MSIYAISDLHLAISVDKSIVKIAFKMPYGIKTLMKNHPSIHKIDD